MAFAYLSQSSRRRSSNLLLRDIFSKSLSIYKLKLISKENRICLFLCSTNICPSFISPNKGYFDKMKSMSSFSKSFWRIPNVSSHFCSITCHGVLCFFKNSIESISFLVGTSIAVAIESFVK